MTQRRPSRPNVLFGRLPRIQRRWVQEQLRNETVGGALLLAAAVLAMIWANSPWAQQYTELLQLRIGPSALHLNLTVAAWIADGLLAVFFFVVGLELKHELVLGSLSNPARAAVPIAAALGGMAVPAGIYTIVNSMLADGSTRGWGIPMATDIAFALAVLAVAGRRLPIALRAFLLTLAVVDDLGAIIVIALFYSSGVTGAWLLLAGACFGLYALAQRRRITSPLVYVPLAFVAWWAMHASGVHATIAGVALGLLTRVRKDFGEQEAPADRLAHRIHPLSAGVVVPVFALASAGVAIEGGDIGATLGSPVALGVVLGLFLGKPIGVFLVAWLVARFTRASLAEGIAWVDVFAVGVLAGVGFTVALLVGELAYAGTSQLAAAKIGILLASLLAGLVAAAVLLARGRHYAKHAG